MSDAIRAWKASPGIDVVDEVRWLGVRTPILMLNGDALVVCMTPSHLRPNLLPSKGAMTA